MTDDLLDVVSCRTLFYFYRHREKCNLFFSNSNGLLRYFGVWKKKNKSADVIWGGFDAISVYVGEQPNKMHTEVTLLHKCI